MDISFRGGENIAMKIPKSKYDATVAFYRDVLKLELKEQLINNPTISRTCKVKFGSNVLWLDCVDNYAHSEIWLELKTTDVHAATTHLEANGIGVCDELEKLSDDSHWIMDPAGTVFVLTK
jgi:predicted enzyme related to lactoylglutathione lyase